MTNLTAAECDQVQAVWLRRYEALRFPKGTRRRTDAKPNPRPIADPPKLTAPPKPVRPTHCQCGCGGLLPVTKHPGRPFRYLKGHDRWSRFNAWWADVRPKLET